MNNIKHTNCIENVYLSTRLIAIGLSNTQFDGKDFVQLLNHIEYIYIQAAVSITNQQGSYRCGAMGLVRIEKEFIATEIAGPVGHAQPWYTARLHKAAKRHVRPPSTAGAPLAIHASRGTSDNRRSDDVSWLYGSERAHHGGLDGHRGVQPLRKRRPANRDTVRAVAQINPSFMTEHGDYVYWSDCNVLLDDMGSIMAMRK